MKTRFTELVGCAVPLQLAPMGQVCTPELIGAVTGAGAMGMTGIPLAPPAVVANALDGLLAPATGPVGFNVLVPFLDLEVVAVAAQRCKVVDFYHGEVDPTAVRHVHDGGALAGWQVGAADEARAAEDAGCDLLVVRGTEGGGRMYGQRSLWPLLDDVLDAAGLAVVAAGGIATARGVAAALAAGADAVRVGTRFVATVESGAHDVWKQAIVDAEAVDSVLTDEFAAMWPSPVKTSRVLQQSIDAARKAPDVVGTLRLGEHDIDMPRFAAAPPTTNASGNVEAMPMYAGESAGAVHAIEHAADVVRELADGARQHLQRAAEQAAQ
jgi:NAD(P)H-dependent flavin oxidoreductase YrpB (nitropropane dioxygenase family)